jgi:hypothetical protein
MSLYLPPWVVERRRREFEAAIWRNVTAQDPLAQKYTVLLQRIGPGLAIVKAHDTIHDDVPLRPGFYHFLQKPDDAPLQVTALESGDGGFAEPGGWIFDALARGNLRERRVRDRLEQRDRAEQDEIVRERERRNEDRRQHLKEAVNAAVRTQVSMSRDRPWSQNVAGRRGAKR